jgi:hypothetical protein
MVPSSINNCVAGNINNSCTFGQYKNANENSFNAKKRPRTSDEGNNAVERIKYTEAGARRNPKKRKSIVIAQQVAPLVIIPSGWQLRLRYFLFTSATNTNGNGSLWPPLSLAISPQSRTNDEGAQQLTISH